MHHKTYILGMFSKTILLIALLLLLTSVSQASSILVPMDRSQKNHLRAYGVVFQLLQNGDVVNWLLNYRGGSFLIDNEDLGRRLALTNGVSFSPVSDAEIKAIKDIIQISNMDMVKIETAPRIAVYTPLDAMPWDDAVTLALTYANIPFDKIYDDEIMSGALENYDWLHLHHEDFTGQQSKFYASFGHTDWYRQRKNEDLRRAKNWGFSKITEFKQEIAFRIRDYVERGGFLFAMCLATETLDIALATRGVDIAAEVYDGDAFDKNANSKLDFTHTFAFTDFQVNLNPFIPAFSNIDHNQVNTPNKLEAKDFLLFEFSAKYDPIPSILVQNHTSIVKGFLGLSTSFTPSKIKSDIIILGRVGDDGPVNYLHGRRGEGRFTFFGGHDPEDYAHRVGDSQTQLEYHTSSAGYRLILNNILFPSVKIKRLRT